jgi:hypothetical protein
MPIIIQRITREVTAKKIGAHKDAMVPVDGRGFVALMRNYVSAINKGALPDVESAWQLLSKAHCQEAVNRAKKAFMVTLEQGREKLCGSTNRPLNSQELEALTAEAFKESHTQFKKSAVGDPRSTATFLQQLNTELATYKAGSAGVKVCDGGLLKEFTDKNYELALTSGRSVVNQAVNALSATKFPDFETFKAARFKTAADLDSKLQNNVAFLELSDQFIQILNNLSTKVGLQFDISAGEKEKENLIAVSAQKEIEHEKKNTQLQEALVAQKQIKATVTHDKDFLRNQTERDYMELKERYALEKKLREEQIASDRRSGRDQRASALNQELEQKKQSTFAMMMQMQKDANQRQGALERQLLEMQQHPVPAPVQQQRRGGLLSSLLSPVTGLVDGLVGGGEGGLLGGLLGGGGGGGGGGLLAGVLGGGNR